MSATGFLSAAGGELGRSRNVDWWNAEHLARKNLRARQCAPSGFGEHEPVARPVRRGDPALADRDRFFNQMLEILEGVFEPLDLR